MATNYVSKGEVLDWPNNTGVDYLSDDVVPMSNRIGVALEDIPDGSRGSVGVMGVYRLPKTSAREWEPGHRLVWVHDREEFDLEDKVTIGRLDIRGAAVAVDYASSGEDLAPVFINAGIGKVADPWPANYVGDVYWIDYTNDNGEDIDCCDFIRVGSLIAVAAENIPDGETGRVIVRGKFKAPKEVGDEWSPGDRLTWIHSDRHFERERQASPSSGDVKGAAVASDYADEGDDTGTVLLNIGIGEFKD